MPLLKTKLQRKIEKWGISRDLSKTVLFITIENFYTAIEIRDDPMLENFPVAIVGKGRVLSANL